MRIVGPYYLFLTNFLSNWHRADIRTPNARITFSSTEQGYMYEKAQFFGDYQIANRLLKYPMEPREAKDLGRVVEGYDENLWETVRFGFMVYVNYLKYTQHPDLCERLLETKDLILVECNPRDKIWGIGLDEKSPLAENKATWQGRNLLGEALMKVREMVKPRP